MIESLVDLLGRLPPQATTFTLAMLPISELRGAIPYAVSIGGLPWQEAYIIAVTGNFVPVIPILLAVGTVSDRLRRIPAFDRFFDWLFARTRRKGRLIEKFEALGLILFVAVPLPVTGAWTGAIAAFLFGVRKSLAVPAILAGICIAGGIVTLASMGVISWWGIGR